jgi:hypothetical protein
MFFGVKHSAHYKLSIFHPFWTFLFPELTKKTQSDYFCFLDFEGTAAIAAAGESVGHG